MSHDDVSLHGARDGQDHLQPLESGGQGPIGRPSQHSDPTDPRIQPNWGQDQPPNQPAIPGIDGQLIGYGHIIGHTYAGPIPPPHIIDGYERIQPGLGKRILDDAHEDTIADRLITQKAFDHAIWEAKAGFRVAAFITFASIVGIFFCLLFLDSPESFVGAAFLGLASLTPLVRTFLNRDQQKPAANELAVNPEDNKNRPI